MRGLIIVLITILASIGYADDALIQGVITQSNAYDVRPAPNGGTGDNRDADDDIFTKDDYRQKFFDDFGHEISRLKIRLFKFPEMYALQGQAMGEAYLATEEWRHTSDKGIDGLEDAFKYATLEAAKQSRSGQAIERFFQKLRLRPFAESEKESDFESRRRTRVGFLFGRESSRFPKIGYEISDRPKILFETYQRSKVNGTTVDENGVAIEQLILIRHQLSLRTDLFDMQTIGRVRYEIDNIRGWFGVTFEYDFEDETTRFYFDDFEIGDAIFLSGGISYHGQNNEFGFHNNQQIAPQGSVTFSLGLHGSVYGISDIPKALNPMNWTNPFKRRHQRQQRLAHNEQQLLIYASAR